MLAVVVPLAWHGRQLSGTDLAGVAVYVAVTFGLVVLVVAAARSDRMLDRLSAIPRRVRNRFARARQADLVADRSGAAVDELRLAIDAARGDLSALRRVAVHAIAWPCSVPCSSPLRAPRSASTSPSLAVLVTYCLTTTFAIVGFLPGGIGFAEISMGATLHAFGVDAAHTVAAVALYRLFDLWLPLVLGAVALRSRPVGHRPYRHGDRTAMSSSDHATPPAWRPRPSPAAWAFARRWAGVLVCAALCATYLVVQPASVDYASGSFRARLFGTGSTLWNNAGSAAMRCPAMG